MSEKKQTGEQDSATGGEAKDSREKKGSQENKGSDEKKGSDRKAQAQRKQRKEQSKAANVSSPDLHESPEILSPLEAFRDFASRVARGEQIIPPTLLSKYERRLYVRKTLLEDHSERLQNRPEAVDEKFRTLAASCFSFFRGTALLYYRDYAGTDAGWPLVLCQGDVHPENFGVMPSADGTPVFGPNDFDEVHFAPFSYDVKRGAVGFELAMRDLGMKKKVRKSAIEAFVKGYLVGLQEFATDSRETNLSLRIDNSPPMIKELLQDARTNRKKWLSKLVDLHDGRFIPTDEVVPLSSHVAEFQGHIDDYAKHNSPELAPTRIQKLVVKDVALKKGSGTASLGLDRYFVLIEGPDEEDCGDLILEMKQARRSALFGLSPVDTDVDLFADLSREADRVVTGQAVHLSGGDPYYGTVCIGKTSYLVRERSPFKDEIDIDDLDADDWCEYAGICGRTLALAHARSDSDTGIQEGDAEKAILSAINPASFPRDIIGFVRMATKRIRRDWEAFKEDLAEQVFDIRRRF